MKIYYKKDNFFYTLFVTVHVYYKVGVNYAYFYVTYIYLTLSNYNICAIIFISLLIKNMSLVDDFQDLNLEEFFCERSYPSMPEVISSSKGKKASSVYKCRDKFVDKECPGSITISKDQYFTTKPHHAKHSPMQPIECEIKSIRLEMEQLIIDKPSISIQRVLEKKIN